MARKCAVVITFIAPDDVTDEKLYEMMSDAEVQIAQSAVVGTSLPTLTTGFFGSPGGDDSLPTESELDAFVTQKMAPALSLLVPGVDYEESVCANCGKKEHTLSELKACVDSAVGPPRCSECGEPNDDNPGKSMCKTCDEWVVTEGNPPAPTGACEKHPEYDADYCPRCGTATVIV